MYGQQTKKQKTAWLYRFVYTTKWLNFMVLAMIVFFVFHPAQPVLAAETNDDSEQVEEDVSTVDEPVLESTSEPVESSTTEEESMDNDDSVQSEVEVVSEVEDTEDTTQSDDIQSEPEISEPVSSDEDDNDVSIDTTTSTSENVENTVEESVTQDVTQSTTSTAHSDADHVEESSESASSTANVAESSNETTATTSSASSDTTTSEVVGTSSLTGTSSSSFNSDEEELLAVSDSDQLNGATSTEVGLTSSTTTSESLENNASLEELATTTLDMSVPTSTADVPTIVVNALTDSSNAFQFSEQQCVAVGDGAFHCFTGAKQSSLEASETVLADRDSDGDLEIFMLRRGQYQQLTDNTLEDMSPYYDPVSDTVVWQRLIDGRYQIMEWKDGKETQLTKGASNNMEPHRYDEYTVWQTWQTNNWDIMLQTNGTSTVLSTTEAHDVSPNVQGGYIIWNTTNGEDHVVTVQNIATGLQEVISDTEGTRVENPRFVLVYDTKYENGDTVTKGYNAATGEVFPLHAQGGVPMPDIPESDQTGETRALLQTKSGRDEYSDGQTSPRTPVDNASSSSTAVDEETTLVPEVGTTTIETLPLTDYDIIVEPASSSTQTHN